MKFKNVLLIASLFIVTASHAQTVTKDANGNYVAVKRADTTAYKATGKTFTDSSGKVYPMFISANGKLFYYRTSKAGKVYKSYLKIS